MILVGIITLVFWIPLPSWNQDITKPERWHQRHGPRDTKANAEARPARSGRRQTCRSTHLKILDLCVFPWLDRLVHVPCGLRGLPVFMTCPVEAWLRRSPTPWWILMPWPLKTSSLAALVPSPQSDLVPSRSWQRRRARTSPCIVSPVVRHHHPR